MLSSTCKYGIRAVIFIASMSDQKANTGLRQIAHALKIPKPYLAKILQALSRKKILQSTKGPHGGFQLLVPAGKLTLMNIIDAVDEGDFFDSCYVTGERCNFDKPELGVCILHDDLRKEKDHLTEFFSSKTIKELADQVNRTPGIMF